MLSSWLSERRLELGRLLLRLRQCLLLRQSVEARVGSVRRERLRWLGLLASMRR
jgi:hypothetical protein